MRTRALVGGIAASAAVLFVGYQAGTSVIAANTESAPAAPTTTTHHTAAAPSTTTGPTTVPAPTAADPSATPTAAPPAPAPAPAPSTDGTFTGSSVNTRFGSVQVEVTISGGSITEVKALHLTNADGRSVQISNEAAPILHDEVISSQSANVSNVSGATYTSQAYLSSVQSALDQAGF